MAERSGLIKMKGNPLTLVGNEVKVGDTAPDFTVFNENLEPVKLSSFSGKTIVIISVPSIDTPVCDMEARRFNREAGNLADNIVILTISMDLPFAQKRWCASAGIENIQLLSDYRNASFGNSFGVLIKELGLLARTIFIIDGEGKVQYVQYVKETTDEPYYDEVLTAINKTLKK
jgi:thiol peroxidase